MNRSDYLNQARQTICNDRQDIHGKPEDTHDLIARYWSTYLSQAAEREVFITADDVAMMMVLFKIARFSVNPYHQDNIVDMIGYAAIAGEIVDRVRSSLGSDEYLNEA